jgi:hypothetical protein
MRQISVLYNASVKLEENTFCVNSVNNYGKALR